MKATDTRVMSTDTWKLVPLVFLPIHYFQPYLHSLLQSTSTLGTKERASVEIDLVSVDNEQEFVDVTLH